MCFKTNKKFKYKYVIIYVGVLHLYNIICYDKYMYKSNAMNWQWLNWERTLGELTNPSNFSDVRPYLY